MRSHRSRDAFAAGLPIVPATIPSCLSHLPIATCCRTAHRACIRHRAAYRACQTRLCYLRAYCRAVHRACIRRRAAYRTCHYTAAGARCANRNLLQSCPSRLHSPTGCLLRSPWNQAIRYSRDSHENPNVLWGWWMQIGLATPTPADLSPAFIGHRQIMTGFTPFAARLLRCIGVYYLIACVFGVYMILFPHIYIFFFMFTHR